MHFEWAILTEGRMCWKVVDLFTNEEFCLHAIMGARPPSIIGSAEDYENEDDENRDSDLIARVETKKSGVGR